MPGGVAARISSPGHIDTIVTREVGLDELHGVFEGYMEGSVTGRTVIRIAG